MKREMVLWLTGLIIQTLTQLEDKPSLTCEVEGDDSHWAQIVPEDSTSSGKLSGFTLNFAYRHSDEPLAILKEVGLGLPPGSRVIEWEAGGFATLWLRPDLPVVALAHLTGDIIEKVQNTKGDYQLVAWIEHGI